MSSRLFGSIEKVVEKGVHKVFFGGYAGFQGFLYMRHWFHKVQSLRVVMASSLMATDSGFGLDVESIMSISFWSHVTFYTVCL